MKQIYILTKLFNVHDRLSSLYLCNEIDMWIKSGELHDFQKCFLPYRDSNEKLKNRGDQTFEIFKMDCATVRDSSILVGYFDGPNYDSGIGFEIGFAYAQNKPIILLSSDYFEIVNANGKNSISALTSSATNIIHLKNYQNEYDNYGLNLLSFRDELNKRLLVMLKTKCYRTNHINYNLHSEPKCDLFIDYNFTKTESSRLVLGKILLLLQSQGTTYYIATEEDFGYAPRVLSKLQCAKTVLIYGDCCFDFGVDSSIVQGMAFALQKKIVLFSSEKLCLYQSDAFVLNKNPMIEHSAKIIHSLAELREELIRI